jgi:hypothetical protein
MALIAYPQMWGIFFTYVNHLLHNCGTCVPLLWAIKTDRVKTIERPAINIKRNSIRRKKDGALR